MFIDILTTMANIEIHLTWCLLPQEIKSAIQVQIFNRAVCISLSANALKKGICIHLFSSQQWENSKEVGFFSNSLSNSIGMFILNFKSTIMTCAALGSWHKQTAQMFSPFLLYKVYILNISCFFLCMDVC